MKSLSQLSKLGDFTNLPGALVIPGNEFLVLPKGGYPRPPTGLGRNFPGRGAPRITMEWKTSLLPSLPDFSLSFCSLGFHVPSKENGPDGGAIKENSRGVPPGFFFFFAGRAPGESNFLGASPLRAGKEIKERARILGPNSGSHALWASVGDAPPF